MVEDNFIAQDQEGRHRLLLASSGIPRVRWDEELKWPGSTSVRELWDTLVADIPGIYDRGENVAILQHHRDERVHLASYLAQQVMINDNKYPREVVGTKHEIEARMPDGTLVTQPFTVKMMDVQGARDLYQECNRDDDLDWIAEVCRPDFLFLTEIGYEWANTYYAKVMTDIFYARSDEILPTVVTLAKAPSKVMDKQGEYVYTEVSEIINKFHHKIRLGDE